MLQIMTNPFPSEIPDYPDMVIKGKIADGEQVPYENKVLKFGPWNELGDGGCYSYEAGKYHWKIKDQYAVFLLAFNTYHDEAAQNNWLLKSAGNHEKFFFKNKIIGQWLTICWATLKPCKKQMAEALNKVQIKEELDGIVVEATGNREITNISISESYWALKKRALEDSLTVVLNRALMAIAKAEQQVSTKMMEDLLPGLSNLFGKWGDLGSRFWSWYFHLPKDLANW